jgi:MoaA/NifB/PqqE/SkfB family radical SAM enzyme
MKLPKLITFEVTQRCNCRCEMCRFWSDESACADTKELTIEEIKKIILNVKNFYNKYNEKLFFGITGGEPFLRKDIIEIFEFIKKEKIDYDVISNFSIPNKKVIKKLSKYPPNKLNISLDGIGDTHDLVRGRKIFDKIIENISLLRKFNSNIPIKINSTINKKNINEISKMVLFAIENNFELNFQHLNFVTPEILKKQKQFENSIFNKTFFHEPTFYNLNKNEVKILEKEIKKARKIGLKNNYKFSFLPELNINIFDWYLNPDKLITVTKCDPTRLRIKPNGELVHCERYVYGNLLKDDFEKAINSDEAKYFKNIIIKENMPFCNRCCLRFINYSE